MVPADISGVERIPYGCVIKVSSEDGMTPGEMDGLLAVIGRLGLTLRQLEANGQQAGARISELAERVEALEAEAGGPQ